MELSCEHRFPSRNSVDVLAIGSFPSRCSLSHSLCNRSIAAIVPIDLILLILWLAFRDFNLSNWMFLWSIRPWRQWSHFVFPQVAVGRRSVKVMMKTRSWRRRRWRRRLPKWQVLPTPTQAHHAWSPTVTAMDLSISSQTSKYQCCHDGRISYFSFRSSSRPQAEHLVHYMRASLLPIFRSRGIAAEGQEH